MEIKLIWTSLTLNRPLRQAPTARWGQAGHALRDSFSHRPCWAGLTDLQRLILPGTASSRVFRGVVFSKLSKLLNQERRTGRTLLTSVFTIQWHDQAREVGLAIRSAPTGSPYALMSALHLRAVARRGNAGDRYHLLFFMSHSRLLHPSHHAGKRGYFPAVGGGARVE